MNKPKTDDQIDAEITELISRKIAAEDTDSGWVVAWAAMRCVASTEGNRRAARSDKRGNSARQ